VAIETEKKTPYGVNATYWRIDEVNIFHGRGNAEVVLFGYPNMNARLNSMVPIARRNVMIEDIPAAESGRSAIYPAIKLDPEWEDAIDA